MFHKSTDEEIGAVKRLVAETRARIIELMRQGKKVHVIWDFDGVLGESRSDDVIDALGHDLVRYFKYEERLLFYAPSYGPWCLPIATQVGHSLDFPPSRFTQDIVTARSSIPAIRVHLFCLSYSMLAIRWMLFLGHQPKEGAYRIILDSLKSDPDYVVFCVDDRETHVRTFQSVAENMGMADRAFGIVTPTIHPYTPDELREHIKRVMEAEGDAPVRVPDPWDDMCGVIVIPRGIDHFRKSVFNLIEKASGEGHYQELRRAFERWYGKVGEGRFKTEEELKRAMDEFIVGIWTP